MKFWMRSLQDSVWGNSRKLDIMEKFEKGKYDIVVVGAGHAGCEAGLAAARMGKRRLCCPLILRRWQ